MTRGEFFLRWSELHGGAQIKGIVKWWLAISYEISRPLRWVPPSLITFSALIFAALFLQEISSPLAILYLVLTLLIDGIDGTVAILAGKVSRTGAMLDAFVDRLVETAWAYGLFLLGAPWELVLIAWLASFVQEYARARAAGLGESEVGVVTIAERPVRATLIFIALIAIWVGIAEQNQIAAICSGVWALMQTIAFLSLFHSLRLRLHSASPN